MPNPISFRSPAFMERYIAPIFLEQHQVPPGCVRKGPGSSYNVLPMISTSVVLLGLLILLVLRRRNWYGAKLPLPAGPKPSPLIGNFLDMPRRNIAPALHDLCRKFGELIYRSVQSPGQQLTDS